QLMQQREAFRLQRGPRKAYAGDIAARPAGVGHETGCNWIAAADEHDGWGRGGGLGRAHGGILANDRCHLPVYQIRRECREPIELILRPAEFDRHVVAVDEPGFLQTVADSRNPITGIAGCCARAASGHAAANPPSAASNSRRAMVTVMRPSRARVRKCNDTTPRARCPNCVAPGQDSACFSRVVCFSPESGPQRLITTCRMGANKRRKRCSKLAPCYSITSSARSRNDSGIVRSSALAVVRLTTRSYLVGCSTG